MTNSAQRHKLARKFEKSVEKQQRSWAKKQGVAMTDSDHTATVNDNLLVPLAHASTREFMEGAGNELLASDGPADMQALRSSSALCVNTFDPWRNESLEPVLAALSAPDGASLCFEAKFKTGLKGTPPHLDVAFPGSDEGQVTAIEAKFLEPFGRPTNTFRDSYFKRDDIWEALPHLRVHAASIQGRETSYERLGAAQLIKHSLGLNRQCGTDGFALIYLFFDADDRACRQHRDEIEKFAEVATRDFDFRSLSYRELWDDLGDTEPAAGYSDYLYDRYPG